MSDTGRMTIAEAIRLAAGRLSETSDTSRLDAELLMAHALGTSRSDLLLKHMSDLVPSRFATLVERRLANEPVAYIIGHQEFFGLDILVSPDVLIPRGDSETIVEAALKRAGDTGRVIDLGTGSGCLLLAFLAGKPGWIGVGIDASEAATMVAQTNAQALNLAERTEMKAGDWSTPGWSDHLGRFDLVLSNPPYVETGADLAPSVREFEPPSALFAGADGLEEYRQLIPQLPGLLSPEGIAIFEIGYAQAGAVSQIATTHGFSCEIQLDLAGRARAAILTRGVGKAIQTV